MGEKIMDKKFKNEKYFGKLFIQEKFLNKKNIYKKMVKIYRKKKINNKYMINLYK